MKGYQLQVFTDFNGSARIRVCSAAGGFVGYVAHSVLIGQGDAQRPTTAFATPEDAQRHAEDIARGAGWFVVSTLGGFEIVNYHGHTMKLSAMIETVNELNRE